jgi:hypothetical protein
MNIRKNGRNITARSNTFICRLARYLSKPAVLTRCEYVSDWMRRGGNAANDDGITGICVHGNAANDDGVAGICGCGVCADAVVENYGY